MLQIPVKEGESIERALKKYKKKFERTGVLKELRERKEYTKKSVVKRQQVIKAQYVEKLKAAGPGADRFRQREGFIGKHVELLVFGSLKLMLNFR